MIVNSQLCVLRILRPESAEFDLQLRILLLGSLET